jgi:hypothetical protein
MNGIRTAMVLGLMSCAGAAAASDLYRCDYINHTVYQGSPCAIGVQQRAIDPANARREQIRESMEQERLRKKKEAEQGPENGAAGA